MNCHAPIWCTGLLAALLAAGAERGAGQVQQGRSIEISAPKDELATTNALESAQKQLREDLLQEQMRDTILKPFHSGSDSLEGMAASPYIPEQPGPSPEEIRKLKELIQERRAWLYGDAAAATERDANKDDPFSEDPNAANNNGSEEDTLSVLKRQYMALENTKGSETNTMSTDESSMDGTGNGRDTDTLTGERRDRKGKTDTHSDDNTDSNDKTAQDQNDNPLKHLIDAQTPGQSDLVMPKNLFSDVFAPTASDTPGKLSPREEQRASDFQKLLNGDNSPVGGGLQANPLSTLGDTAGAGSMADGNLADTHSLPTMATMPGYNPVSSLSPAMASPASVAAPAPVIQPPPPMQFNRSFGPDQRQF